MTITIRSIKTSISHRSSSAHRSINRSATLAIQSKQIRLSSDLIPVMNFIILFRSSFIKTNLRLTVDLVLSEFSFESG
ncbi:hypothetical protein Hanom_Chr02g00107441 [Helianthus anomalus]